MEMKVVSCVSLSHIPFTLRQFATIINNNLEKSFHSFSLSLYLPFSFCLSFPCLSSASQRERVVVVGGGGGAKIEREVVSPFLALLLDLYLCLSGWPSLKYRGVIHDRLLAFSELTGVQAKAKIFLCS